MSFSSKYWLSKLVSYAIVAIAVLVFLQFATVQSYQYFDFTYLDDGDHIAIAKYTGPGGDVVIPDAIAGKPVTSIIYPRASGDLQQVLVSYGAFARCAGLTSVIIPNSITNIGDAVFYDCGNMTNVVLPRNLANIGIQAFLCCATLTEVSFSDKLCTIGMEAFAFCFSLTNITIPSSVTNIGEFAFASCQSLVAITVDPLNAMYSSHDGVLFNKDQTKLIQCPPGKSGSYIVPDGVVEIGSWAFDNCARLGEIIIPGSVNKLERDAFRHCTNLANVYFEGDAPKADPTVFADTEKVTVNYQSGNNSWAGCTNYAGRPTATRKVP